MKKTLPAAAVLTILAGVVTVQAQDPLTYVDENGETVTYGEEQDWVRTIHYVFPDCPRRNHDLEQYTRGSEVWIKPADGPAEYHIGNNGECGWDAVMTPVEAGFSADIELVPEADLYADPGQAQKAEITVTYVSRQPEKTGNPEIPGPVTEETAAPEIIERLAALAGRKFTGYGSDEISESAREKIRTAAGTPEGEVYFLVGGT